MCEIVINDLVDELSEDNKRLFKETLVLRQCFDVLNEFKIYLNKILSLKTILKDLNHLSLEDIQTLQQLDTRFTAIITQTRDHSVNHRISTHEETIDETLVSKTGSDYHSKRLETL